MNFLKRDTPPPQFNDILNLFWANQGYNIDSEKIAELGRSPI